MRTAVCRNRRTEITKHPCEHAMIPSQAHSDFLLIAFHVASCVLDRLSNCFPEPSLPWLWDHWHLPKFNEPLRHLSKAMLALKSDSSSKIYSSSRQVRLPESRQKSWADTIRNLDERPNHAESILDP